MSSNICHCPPIDDDQCCGDGVHKIDAGLEGSSVVARREGHKDPDYDARNTVEYESGPPVRGEADAISDHWNAGKADDT
jgi:hypothetical protein